MHCCVHSSSVEDASQDVIVGGKDDVDDDDEEEAEEEGVLTRLHRKGAHSPSNATGSESEVGHLDQSIVQVYGSAQESSWQVRCEGQLLSFSQSL